jgi:hypothetical protein
MNLSRSSFDFQFGFMPASNADLFVIFFPVHKFASLLNRCWRLDWMPTVGQIKTAGPDKMKKHTSGVGLGFGQEASIQSGSPVAIGRESLDKRFWLLL